jgi:hypothetical protein
MPVDEITARSLRYGVTYLERGPDPLAGALPIGEGRSPTVVLAGEGERRYAAGATYIVKAAGLATAGAYTAAEIVLEPGAALLLYTDGLVERRREAIDAALDRLLEALAARTGTPPDALLAALAETLLVDEQEDDDVCALLFTRR